MKRIFVLLTLCAISCLFSLARVVKSPYILAGNIDDFDIAEVELTDKETRLRLVLDANPKEFSGIAQDAYLSADGRKYKMTKVEQLSKTEGGYGITAEFDLRFEPMPEDTRAFDFIEAGGKGRKLWDVDLTGKKVEIPAIFKTRAPADLKIPAFKFAIDSVTVNLHILNYRPKMGNSLGYGINSLIRQQTTYSESGKLPRVSVDAEGNCSFKLLLKGTREMFFMNVGDNTLYGSVTLAPGEKLDVWIDAAFSGCDAMSKRNDLDRDRSWVISNGRYRNYDLAQRGAKSYRMELHTGEFADYHMTADEYTDHTIKVYKDLLAKINGDSRLTPFRKRIARNKLAAELIYATISRNYLLQHNYWHVHNSFGEPAPDDSIKAVFTAAHTKRIAGIVNINDPALMFEALSQHLATTTFNIPGVQDRQLYPLALFYEQYKKAGANDELDKAGMSKLAAFKIPFYTEVVKLRHNEMMANLKKYNAKKIQPGFAVADDEMFDAIIAPHKGKVVVVDVWETWCGPCCAAIKAHEPLKKTTFAGKDIVWIYLASESSPKDDYVKMVQGIDGLHYRLTKSQSDAVAERFGIRFIPSYILVDREGKAVLLSDEEEENYEETILKKL